MQIFIKTPIGETVTMNVSPEDTIKKLIDNIGEKIKIPIKYIRLICNSKVLNDTSKTLQYYNITKEITINVSLNVFVKPTSDMDTPKHPLDTEDYKKNFDYNDLENANLLIQSKLIEGWDIERIYKYKILNNMILKSLERQYAFHEKYKKLRIQIGSENYIIIHNLKLLRSSLE